MGFRVSGKGYGFGFGVYRVWVQGLQALGGGTGCQGLRILAWWRSFGVRVSGLGMRVQQLNLQTSSLREVDRIWGIWGSYYNIPKAIFYLLKGDYMGRI